MSYIFCTDLCLEEGQPDIPILSSKEADITFLLIHTVLYYTSTNNVHTRSWVTPLGDLLYPYSHVHFEHPSIAKVFPFPNAIPSIREHNVRDKIQRHGVGAISVGQRLRMGSHQENR